ncbi:adenine deaminase [Nafulsella turpanensis]|uniref:adenine deaminase n=1 Tax=Nafulsella turpanensis TaxID=1265690 RepID=UPI000346471B|nr:adenine deaminase [Nafulsella turpanensis]
MVNQEQQIIRGQLVRISEQTIKGVEIRIEDGKIQSIQEIDNAPEVFILPPFVDAHVHIESSMLVPAEFARLAVVHGTGATVSDPHEIGNVLGVEGVEYMIENGKKVPFKFYFGAPSCVPATPFETAGAVISPNDIDRLFQNPDIKYLAEMMNWPGVLQKDPEVMEKIRIAQKHNRPVDGHAPGLKGQQAHDYATAGISTDHECFTAEEALDKLACGMKILIREGSAAKNFDALVDLLHEHSAQMMFCSDDKHPDNLVEGHINQLAARAVKRGVDSFKVLQAACVNPVAHYGLELGQLKEGDPADLIVVKDLQNFEVLKTYLNGQLVAENGKSLIPRSQSNIINKFDASPLQDNQLRIAAKEKHIQIIEASDGQLITKSITEEALIEEGFVSPDPSRDILKLVVLNRYTQNNEPAIAFIRGFGMKEGAIASSVAHDSHNLIAVGTNDKEITKAINLLIEAKGGVAAVKDKEEKVLPLPVAGLMSADDGYEVAAAYSHVDAFAKSMGSKLSSPFMTLSFMALLVIPSLKLSDKGLFNGETFSFTSLFSEDQ